MVILQDGENTLVLEACDAKGAVTRLERRVIKDNQAPVINLARPLDGRVVSSPDLQIGGTCNDLSGVSLTINDQAVKVVNGAFSNNITLNPGVNRIIIRAEDGVNNVRTISANVTYSVTTIMIDSPVNNTIVNRAQVTVSGLVTGQIPSKLTINGKTVEVSANGSYSTVQEFGQGQGLQKVIVMAEMPDGSSIGKTVDILVDTERPNDFSVKMNPAGWDNNPKPTFSFATTDEISGIDHYEIRLNGGVWIGPVTSPYQFAQDLTGGAQVEVKAVDKAGNETVGRIGIDRKRSVANESEDVRNGSDKYGKAYYKSIIDKYSNPYYETLSGASALSAYNSYFANNNESVVTSSGSLNINATDLVLPGRNGFDLVVKRIYDSDLAQEQGAELYDSVIYDSEGFHGLPEPQYRNLRKPPVDTFSRGWTLNIPWIETNQQGKFLRLPEGLYSTGYPWG